MGPVKRLMLESPTAMGLVVNQWGKDALPLRATAQLQEEATATTAEPDKTVKTGAQVGDIPGYAEGIWAGRLRKHQKKRTLEDEFPKGGEM